MPVVLLSAAEDSQILLKGLIGSFTGSIRLRVIRRTDVLMDIQKTAYEINRRDWSSDVCSSDLVDI